jgi:6-phosphogluconolactonase (cycloisomerase 2 family)
LILNSAGSIPNLIFQGPEVNASRRKMRMKFNKSGQLLLVSAVSLLVASFLTACETLTVDFVYVASAKAAGANNYGEIDVFEVNSESGFMRQIPTSPFPSGGRNPVAEAVSSDNLNLYVVNQDDNSIVQQGIGTDGKLYPQNTTNTPGVYPLAVAVNGSNLFVVDTYQPLPICSTANPCSGSVAVYPILPAQGTTAVGSLGPPVANSNNPSLTYWPLSLPGKPNDVIEPTSINVLKSGAFAYVAAYDANAGANYLFGFAVASSGALTPLNGGAPLGGGAFAVGSCPSAYLNAPFITGTCPAAIASDTSSTYVYVADETSGRILGYTVGSTGLLTALGAPYPTGNQPSAITIDPTYPYLYVANAQDSTVTAFTMSSGLLTRIGSYPTGLQPVAIGIDPSTSHFLYTVNFLGSGVNGTVSGFELSATGTTAGSLVNSQNSPYISNAQPTAVAAISHNGTGGGIAK